MNFLITIYKKEIKELLRDRKTLLAMIVFPFVLMPLLLSVIIFINKSKSDEARDKIIHIAIEDNGNGAELLKRLKRRKDIKFFDNIDVADYNQLIRNDSIDIGLEIDPSFDQAINEWRTGAIDLYYNATNDTLIVKRIVSTIERFHKDVLQYRLDSLGVTMTALKPTKIRSQNVYSTRESMGKMAGGMLPYIFVVFAFIGTMYPTIDLFTGEKERGTIETILVTPASRAQILLGKMLVVITTGTVSGLLTILGLFAALKFTPEIPGFILHIVSQILHPEAVLLVILMIVPLTTFFAGFLIPIAIKAKSFKEAQSMAQPSMIIMIVSLIAGTMPSVKLTWVTAMIPVLNVGLACREIVAGTLNYSILPLVFISLFAFAAISVAICIRWFGNENNMLRT